MIAAVAVDDEGRLWVRRTDTPVNAPQFDLYDRNGVALGIVQGRGRIIGVPRVVGNRVYYVELDPDDVPFIVRAVIR